MNLEFPIVKLLDYETRWEELEASPNPFAVVVMAHLKTQVTTQDPQGRLRWKLQLIRGLYERGFSHQDILELFRVLDWMMGLPEPLKLEFWDELQRFEEDKKMPYITSVEQIGIEKGLKQGLQQGREEGRRDVCQTVINSFLAARFGTLDDELVSLVEQLVAVPAEELSTVIVKISTLSREELLKEFIKQDLER
jgi:hypothetical protein